jgi:hypothetical protein
LDFGVELTRTFDAQTLANALDSWGWIGLEGKTPVFTSALGDVFFRAADGFWFLDRLAGTLTHPWETAEQLQADLDTAEGQSRYLSANLVWAAHERGLVLSSTQVYDFAVPPIMGGAQGVENLAVSDFEAAVNIAGQIHDQLRSVPPGTPIRVEIAQPPDQS